MKRLFVLLLLALLMPLQFSWAAVGAYCQHESGQKAGHFGHHSHDHKAADPAPDPSAPSGASLDQDCSACHQAALKLIFADSTRHPEPAGASAPESGPPRFSSLPAAEPERPNWLAAA